MNLLYITAVWSGDGEPNMHSDFVQEAAVQGHNVTVLALCEKRNQIKTAFYTENDIDILLVRCGNIQKTGKYEKVISSVTANFLLMRAVKKHLKDKKFDVVIWSVSTTLIYYSVNRIKKRFSAKEYLLLKEYWPQDPVDLGAMKEGGMVYSVLKHVEKKMLDQADFIGVSSPAAVKYVNDRYPQNTPKCEVCPHCEKPLTVDRSRRKEILQNYGIPEDKVIFLYGGNFGVSQGVEDMAACVGAASEIDDVYFVMLGSGTEYDKVKMALAQYSNVKFLPGQKYSAFFSLASVCDCGLIFLFKGYKVPNIPGKLNTYLNAEVPIIACVDKTTDAGDILTDAGAGIKVYSGDVPAFCEAVGALRDINLRRKMSCNAKKLLCERFTPQKAVDIVASHFKEFGV